MDDDGDDGDDGGGGVVAGAEQGAAGDSSSRLFFPSSQVECEPVSGSDQKVTQPERQAGRQVGDRHTTT